MDAEVNYVVEVELPIPTGIHNTPSVETTEFYVAGTKFSRGILDTSLQWFPLKGERHTLSAARAALEATRRMPEYTTRKMRIIVPRANGMGEDVLIEVNPGDPPCIELS